VALSHQIEVAHSNQQLCTVGLGNGNPFTIGFLLPLLRFIGATPTSEVVADCITFAKSAIASGGARIHGFREDGYLTFGVLRGLELWLDRAEFREVVDKAIVWSLAELYKQISLFRSQSDDDSDAFQLGFNLLLQYQYNRTAVKDPIIRLGLQTLFEAHLERGIWEKKDPLFVSGEAGNAYCFSFELLNAILECFESTHYLLAPYEANLERALQWVVRNRNTDCGPGVWRSGHRVDDVRPESWATAEVYLFLQLYNSFISQQTQVLVLDHFKGELASNPDPDAFRSMYHPKIQFSDARVSLPIDRLFTDRLLTPLQANRFGKTSFSLAKAKDRKLKIRSGILFGPPGTGKTTYVRAIARYLGWPLIVLDPSSFAKEGLPLLPTTTSRIFDFLCELEDTVVFFDEMEEMVRERSGADGSSFEQRFLTTSLLPKLQYLSDRAKCIFLLATNHFGTIDEAVRREGRFGFRIQVLHACFEEKVRMLRDNWPDATPTVLAEVERAKEKVEWANRTEWREVIEELVAGGDSRDILDAFRPSLLLPENREKRSQYVSETKFNSFGVRNR